MRRDSFRGLFYFKKNEEEPSLNKRNRMKFESVNKGNQVNGGCGKKGVIFQIGSPFFRKRK
jgi:hypothetical protein